MTRLFLFAGIRLQQALQLIQFVRECDEVMFWISDKEAFVTSEEFGHDLEHVEVLQKKYDEFVKVGPSLSTTNYIFCSIYRVISCCRT